MLPAVAGIFVQMFDLCIIIILNEYDTILYYVQHPAQHSHNSAAHSAKFLVK
jgi:hypothetical protein